MFICIIYLVLISCVIFNCEINFICGFIILLCFILFFNKQITMLRRSELIKELSLPVIFIKFIDYLFFKQELRREENIDLIKIEKYYFYSSQLVLGKEKDLIKAPKVITDLAIKWIPKIIQNNVSKEIFKKLKHSLGKWDFNLLNVNEQGKTKQVKEYFVYSTGTTKSEIESNGEIIKNVKISNNAEVSQFFTTREMIAVDRKIKPIKLKFGYKNFTKKALIKNEKEIVENLSECIKKGNLIVVNPELDKISSVELEIVSNEHGVYLVPLSISEEKKK